MFKTPDIISQTDNAPQAEMAWEYAVEWGGWDSVASHQVFEAQMKNECPADWYVAPGWQSSHVCECGRRFLDFNNYLDHECPDYYWT